MCSGDPWTCCRAFAQYTDDSRASTVVESVFVRLRVPAGQVGESSGHALAGLFTRRERDVRIAHGLPFARELFGQAVPLLPLPRFLRGIELRNQRAHDGPMLGEFGREPQLPALQNRVSPRGIDNFA